MSGYKIIDLKNKAITVDDSTGITVSGIYDAIESSFKAILLCGVKLGTSELKPMYVTPIVSGDDYIINLYDVVTSGTKTETYIMTIDDDDKVTVAKATITSAT